jgi:hypothetical protein
VAPPVDAQGHDLLPLARGQAEVVRACACTGLALGGGREWLLRTPGWALVLPVEGLPGDPPRDRQLFAKPEDRWEVNNVVQHHLELADHLEAVLRAFVAAAGQSGPLQPPVVCDEDDLVREESGDRSQHET